MAKRTSSGPGPTASRRCGARSAAYRAKVRVYRHGLGDCILVALPRASGGDYFILIDCGVILGTQDASNLMTNVMEDVVATTHGKVDLLLATHEHWDHVSGFVQAAETFARLEVGEVWMAWTEDADDPVAQELRAGREKALQALRLSALHMQMAGDADKAEEITGLLDFFGAAHGASTRDALEAVRAKAKPHPRYCHPQDAPVTLADTGVRAYVLGPPRDEKLLKKARPSSRDPETYGMAVDALQATLDAGLSDVVEAPFDAMYTIPLPVAREMDFFKARYWGGSDWRRVDSAWLDGAAELALQLDNATNNTSLVLALELPDDDVLLFAADAQVGNWLSWQTLAWQVDGRGVSGPDLVRRTVFYKVGHHGSHNATLRALGLEMMDRLGVAVIPVNEQMAKKKHWGQMPFAPLIEALNRQADGRVVRTDAALPEVAATQVEGTNPLCFEVSL